MMYALYKLRDHSRERFFWLPRHVQKSIPNFPAYYRLLLIIISPDVSLCVVWIAKLKKKFIIFRWNPKPMKFEFSQEWLRKKFLQEAENINLFLSMTWMSIKHKLSYVRYAWRHTSTIPGLVKNGFSQRELSS